MSRIFSLSRCYQSYIAETIGRLNVVAFSFRLLRRLCSLVIKDVSEHGKRPFSSLLSICHLPVSFPLRHILRATRQVLMKLDTRRSPTVLPVRISCVCPHHRRARVPHPAGQSPYPDEIYDAERNLSCRTARRTTRQANGTRPDPTSGRKI